MENLTKTLFRALPLAGLFCLLAGLGRSIYYALLDWPAYTLLGVGLALFLTLFIKAEAANIKYYLHVFVYSVLVGGLCVVGYLFSMRYDHKVDLTKQSIYTLSPASRMVLAHLEEPVTITVFTPLPESLFDKRDLYVKASSKIQWDFVNADKHPEVAKRMGDKVANGEVFVACGENKKRLGLVELDEDFENVLTNSIIEVTRDDKPRIYFLSGHGEVAFEAPAKEKGQKQGPSLGAFCRFLNKRGILTSQLDLAAVGDVPPDATLVVMAGPRQDLFAPEANALEDFLKKRHGKLLVMLDVPSKDFFASQRNIESLLGEWGLDMPNKVILDLQSKKMGLSPVQPIVSAYHPEHPITRELGTRPQRIALDLARPVAVGEVPPEMKATPLILSSTESWTEDLAVVLAKDKVAPPPKEEWKPQIMGVALGEGDPPAIPGLPAKPRSVNLPRLVVFGTSQLIHDTTLLSSQSAVELMLNTVNWLTEREDMIAVPPRQLEGTPITLSSGQLRVMFALLAVLLPGAVFFGGLSWAHLRRRR